VVQLRKLPQNLARRQRNFELLSAFFGTYPDVFVLPRQTAELETGWHMFPVLIRPESGNSQTPRKHTTNVCSHERSDCARGGGWRRRC